MKLVALLLALSLAASAQTTFTDPANLRGERVSPSDGHELPIDQGARGLEQLLRKLNTRASILNIVAHPDDEDGGMLTLYARGLGARVADLSLTRGEGGQNFVTGDFEDALGLIRTQELLANDRYTGVTQMFGTEVDFGFSKTKEESFQKWTHDRVLYDVVRAIRLYRPLVITATFIGNVTDGHGQHQVSGEIAQEAFKAAADPNIFPDQLKEGILPWQALKVYARVPFADINSKGVFDYATNQYVPARFTNYVTGKVTTTKPTADVEVPEGDTDPLLTDPATNQPRNYVQFARIGLSLQRTQISKNMRLPSPGVYNSGYTLYGSCVPATANASLPPFCHPEQAQRTEGPAARPAQPQTSDTFPPANLTTQPNFFTGIDTSLEGIATLAPSAPPALTAYLHAIADKIAQAQQLFDPKNLEASAPPLSDAGELLTKLVIRLKSPSSSDSMMIGSWPQEQREDVLNEILIKQAQANDALVLALGLSLDATTASNNGNLVTGSTVPISLTISSHSHSPLLLVDIQLHNEHGESGLPKKTYIDFFARPLPSGSPYRITMTMMPAGTMIPTRPYFSRRDIEQPFYDLSEPDLRNAPQTPNAFVVQASVAFKNQPSWYLGRTITLERVVHEGPQPISIIPPVSIASAPSNTVLPNLQPAAQLIATLTTEDHTSANINLQSPKGWSIQAKAIPAPDNDPTHAIAFYLHPPATFTDPAIFHLTATTSDHHTYTEGWRPVGYPGLILTNYYTPAITRVVPVDLKLPQHDRIAYLPGTGDAVPEALASVGLTPTILTVADLTAAKLAAFDTVILGVRTYAAHSDLHGAPTQALLDFARTGGNVLVQYQTSDFTSADAPYPLSLGNGEKVVDETDPIQVLDPTSPLFTTPNQITTADFGGWVEERGHGFLATWDTHYTALTETHDRGGPGGVPQLPQRGGLLTVSVGKGRWTYCAFALYRQLPEAVPGAYRLFINLISPRP